MPGIEDPEAGLIEFFSKIAHPVAAGLIFAYIYAIIGSTANSIIVAISQSIKRDILSGGVHVPKDQSTPFWIISAVGVITIFLSYISDGSVFAIATGAFSKMGACIAGPVMIKVFRWRHTAMSLLAAVLAGLATAYFWEASNLNMVMNAAGVGILACLAVNWLGYRVTARRY